MTSLSATTIMVGLGEIRVSQDPETVLACLGLGSCVAVSVFDPIAKVGAMAHVVLPKSHGKTGERAGRYADVAVPLLLKRIRDLGAVDSRLQIYLAGGAQMSLAPGLGTAFKIGEDNVTAVVDVLSEEGLEPKCMEVGGHKGRTMRLFIDSGKATIASAGQENREF